MDDIPSLIEQIDAALKPDGFATQELLRAIRAELSRLTVSPLPGEIAGLIERVDQFNRMELPGQPFGMHMGTNYLVNDLAAALQRVAEERVELLKQLGETAAQRDSVNADCGQFRARLAELEADVEAHLAENNRLHESVGAVRAEYLQRYMDATARITELEADLVRLTEPPNPSITMNDALALLAAQGREIERLQSRITELETERDAAKDQLTQANSLVEYYKADRDAIRAKTIADCMNTIVTVRGFGTASDDYLNGFHDGASAKTDSIRAINQPEAGGGE